MIIIFYYTSICQIFDEFLNHKSDSINFTQTLSDLNINLSVDNKVYVKNEQIPVNLYISNIKNIDNVKIFYEFNNNKYLLSFITEPDTNLIKVLLNPNQSGNYKIFAEIQKKENVFDIINSNSINIQVQ